MAFLPGSRMNADTSIYTVRPGGTSLWIPGIMAESMGIVWGDHLTKEQFEGADIQGLINNRLAAEKGRRKA